MCTYSCCLPSTSRVLSSTSTLIPPTPIHEQANRRTCHYSIVLTRTAIIPNRLMRLFLGLFQQQKTTTWLSTMGRGHPSLVPDPAPIENETS